LLGEVLVEIKLSWWGSAFRDMIDNDNCGTFSLLLSLINEPLLVCEGLFMNEYVNRGDDGIFCPINDDDLLNPGLLAMGLLLLEPLWWLSPYTIVEVVFA
jgi:hypothetical protein